MNESASYYGLNVLEVNWTLHEDNSSSTAQPGSKLYHWYEDDSSKIQISLYGIIFLLAIIGNTLIILTLAQNRRMRTVTNLFLLNLAVSDLLLGVLCMPVTLIGTLLRDFVFGGTMCKLIQFFQACLVSVSAWTLVAISVERYYAICHPLRSLAWQTISHAYKTIAAIWLCSFACMLPTLVLSQLQPTKFGKHKCRETWPSPDYEKAFNLFLDLVLMVSPLLVLAAMYSLIIRTLWKGIKTERALRCSSNANSTVDIYVNLQTNSTTSWRFKNRTNIRQQTNWTTLRNWSDESNSPVGSNSSKRLTTGLRRTNAERSLHNKKRVIRMLCVVVMEFFICWSPLYIINTIVLFVGDKVYEVIGYKGVSFFQLLAYSSSCCNPITYCFMNGGFRKSFLKLFSCFRTDRYRSKFGGAEGSDCQIDMKYSNHRYSEH
ncbi:cholecystokinin receptor-like isoform X1 [Euwallacea fornicatus]|uniref:cholecystokinin receptor-like isoform X1 n=2 Tax=Euwallacea fornicatus TaxID=995702 RepID=UPI00338F5AF3